MLVVADRGSDSEALDDAKAFQFWSASDLRAAGVASPGIFAVPAQLASLALAKERGSTDTRFGQRFPGANYFPLWATNLRHRAAYFPRATHA